MKIDEQLLSANIPLRPTKAPIPNPCLGDSARDARVPKQLLNVLATFDIEHGLAEPGFYITEPAQLRHIETFGFDCVAENLLPLGTNDTGDIIPVDLTTGGVGFLSHDKLGKFSTIREAWAEVAESLGSFCSNALADEDFPRDYWDAVQRKDG